MKTMLGCRGAAAAAMAAVTRARARARRDFMSVGWSALTPTRLMQITLCLTNRRPGVKPRHLNSLLRLRREEHFRLGHQFVRVLVEGLAVGLNRHHAGPFALFDL